MRFLRRVTSGTRGSPQATSLTVLQPDQGRALLLKPARLEGGRIRRLRELRLAHDYLRE